MLERKTVNRALCKAIKKDRRTRKEMAIASGVYTSHLVAVEKGTVPGVVVLDGMLRAFGLRLVVGDPEGEDLVENKD